MQQVRCTLLFASMLQTVQPFQFSCSAPRTVLSYRVHATDSSPGCILAECNEGLRVYAGQLEKAKLFTATTSFHISLSSASTAYNITARTIEHEKCTWIFSSGLVGTHLFFQSVPRLSSCTSEPLSLRNARNYSLKIHYIPCILLRQHSTPLLIPFKYPFLALLDQIDVTLRWHKDRPVACLKLRWLFYLLFFFICYTVKNTSFIERVYWSTAF